MTKHLAVRLALLLAWVLAPAASAQDRPWSGASVLDDPAWRKHFLGSYGFLSGVEPEIDEGDRELLSELIPLMESDPKAAAERLRGELDPRRSAALDFVLANLLFQNGETQPAARHYRDALAKFPDFRRAHKNLGLLLVQEGEFRAALEHLARAAELGDRDGRSFGLMGYAHVQLENYLAAEAAYRNAILQQPDVKDWQLGLARSLLATERHREAISLLDRLIEAEPGNATYWMLQANAFIGVEEPLAAAVNLETVRLMDAASGSSLVLLGDIYMNAAMPELAKSAYLEALEADAAGATFPAAYRAADLLVRARAYDEAAEIVAVIDRRWRSTLSDDEQLELLTLEARLARARNRTKEAARLLESIVRRDGTRGEALIELAAYHHGQGQREKALLLIEQAERLDGFEYQARLQHAQFLVAAREYAAAVEVLRRALEIKREARVERFLAAVEQAVRPE
jgi:tetratricopeptide (TPR) repeat protein